MLFSCQYVKWRRPLLNKKNNNRYICYYLIPSIYPWHEYVISCKYFVLFNFHIIIEWKLCDFLLLQHFLSYFLVGHLSLIHSIISFDALQCEWCCLCMCAHAFRDRTIQFIYGLFFTFVEIFDFISFSFFCLFIGIIKLMWYQKQKLRGNQTTNLKAVKVNTTTNDYNGYRLVLCRFFFCVTILLLFVFFFFVCLSVYFGWYDSIICDSTRFSSIYLLCMQIRRKEIKFI